MITAQNLEEIQTSPRSEKGMCWQRMAETIRWGRGARKQRI